MGILYTFLSFVAAIVILVTIHEFGHFSVARLCGVKVERFSIGFGPVLCRWFDKKGTEFAISAIPLGGYVAMYGGGHEDIPADMRHLAFNQKTVWQRIAILFAGPLANIVLAIVLFWALLLPGTTERKAIIGDITAQSLAEQAGLEYGQEVVSVDGVPTPTWAALSQALVKRLGETGTIDFRLRYPESDFYYDAQITVQNWLNDQVIKDPIAALGISLYIPKIPPIVGEILPNGAAAKGGLASGDSIMTINNKSVASWQDLVSTVRASAGQVMVVGVERNGDLLSLNVTPEIATEEGLEIGRIGAAPRAFSYPESMLHRTEYSVAGAAIAGVTKTWDTAKYVLLSIQKLIVGEISTKNLSGPISIAKVASASAESGLMAFVGFLALLSVFLAVFNLLPVPTLDGGHLFYYFIEVIRGKPVSYQLQQRGNAIGFAVIICLLCVALFNDITQLG